MAPFSSPLLLSFGFGGSQELLHTGRQCTAAAKSQPMLCLVAFFIQVRQQLLLHTRCLLACLTSSQEGNLQPCVSLCRSCWFVLLSVISLHHFQTKVMHRQMIYIAQWNELYKWNAPLSLFLYDVSFWSFFKKKKSSNVSSMIRKGSLVSLCLSYTHTHLSVVHSHTHLLFFLSCMFLHPPGGPAFLHVHSYTKHNQDKRLAHPN